MFTLDLFAWWESFANLLRQLFGAILSYFGWSPLLLVMLLASPGCSIMDSGPRMMETTMTGVVSVAGPLIAKMDPQEMTAGAGGKTTDPRFRLYGHMGPVWFFDVNAELVGADLVFRVDAAGTGRAQVDPEVWAFVTETWNNSALPEDVRKDMISTAIANWINSKATAAPADVPAKTPPADEETPADTGEPIGMAEPPSTVADAGSTAFSWVN